jgi:hypothetical protein
MMTTRRSRMTMTKKCVCCHPGRQHREQRDLAPVPSAQADKANNAGSIGINDVTPVAASKPQKTSNDHRRAPIKGPWVIPQSPCRTSKATMPPRQVCRIPRGGIGRQGGGQRPRHNTIAALARPPKAKLLWANAGYSNKVTSNDERDNHASLATCCDCVMTRQMPVHDAGGNKGMPRVAAPAQHGQRFPRDKGNNAGSMPETTMGQCWR